jgi:putative salt-induced outer membrane protein YdiY
MGNIKNGIKFLGTNFEALTHNRFDGWLLGGGVGYGYAFVLGKHFNLEMELGVGYAYMEYNKYDWDTGVLLGRHDNHHYWGIIKLNVGLSYIF